MAEKKRKRNDEGGERPKKKAAVAPPTGTLRVEYVENKDVLGPVLASTPGLGFPLNISFDAYRLNTGKILPTGEVTELLLHSSKHPRLDYTAREEKDGSSESLLQDYIAVYDPATSKLQIVPVRKVTVRSTLRSEIEELRQEQERKEAKKSTMTAKRHALAAEFGSKKSRKAIEDMAMNAIVNGRTAADGADINAVNTDAVAFSVLQGMSSATAAMPTREELAAAVDSSKPRPQANLAAEYPVDVYPASTVVGSDILTLIPVKDWVDASESGAGVHVTSLFVAKRIQKLVKNKQIEKLKVLRFILLCIKFNDALVGKGGKKPRMVPSKDKFQQAMGEDVPGALANAIRRKFASENNDLPRWHVDYLMTHICAAALIVDNNEVDMHDLKEDLKLENREIKQYFLELGCRVAAPTESERIKFKISKAEATSHNLAKLKLPLQFPKVRTGPNKRR